MEDMIRLTVRIPPTRTARFTTNLPKAGAPNDQIKNHSLNTTKLDKV